ncbi:proA [Sorangium cellulosum So ce56]|uniref:Gamma-glutamyl phosphate reductase n=1 Tax=Sorangium cellulosum (strain So ce56) TaxID=448385 RepID=PROA_SORC5|nr:glutamate-5-semialdehyde dehydrogenase [Sorangium cellulosum]A9GVS8.1 RecName: Full=Gamma-glutamyl phosphate reductase; Short=GPR; AltName: Full=Glutamate-5-semialdehyde dehydrogenase; AltName: Full=Glutamyl-gamma-semialdehyde dehydrogenase; Short=GSA dehydrogenase [Sorangium cellulosum So ce56]CAN93836.1 proA [Sorangium cellulosum So ce56]
MEQSNIDLEGALRALCQRARTAARALAPLDRAQKDRALRAIAERLRAEAGEGKRSAVLAANAEDVAAARAAGVSEALVDRLVLDEARLAAIAGAVLEIAAASDPVGQVVGMERRPNGLLVGQVRVPLGVIAMIYESRPNVTVDAAVLCLKSGNAAILRGGKEAARSNAALGELISDALRSVGLPADAVQMVPSLDREATRILLGLTGMIDLAIPRGGEGLIRFVAENARVPVIQHYKGVNHLYADAGCDLEMACRLVENGKLQRPGVCNALECLLVHEDVAAPLLGRVAALSERGLELRGDAATCALVPSARKAAEDDYGREFLAPILAVRVVRSLDEAIEHIGRYGSMHTEVICTPRYDHAQRFLREVDASCVLVNASSRFNDGGELGLGAEIGISTTKLHAYGPMGLASLTTLKWIAYGEGQTR